MKVLLTGASSFTGFWFAKTLVQAGQEVVCPVTGSLDRYEGLRRERFCALRSMCHLVPSAPFGTPAFLQLIRSTNWDMLCHHGAAEMANYRSPAFNVHQALKQNTLELPEVLRVFQQRGGQGVILTGTIFENDEGVGEEPLRAFSPYGLSKGLTYQVFRYYCSEAGLTLGKFVLPNPFGPLEEPRFTAYLMRTWQQGRTAVVKTPDYVRDNIHADLLAAVYAGFVKSVATTSKPLCKANPSGYVESQGQFSQRVAGEVRSRLGWDCDLELNRQQEFNEPLRRVNTQPAALLAPEWKERSAWDSFVEFYLRTPG